MPSPGDAICRPRGWFSPVFGGSTKSLSQTPTNSKTWLDRLSLWQGYWLLFLTAWIPISISAIWIGIIVGGVFWTATSALALKEVLEEMPKDGSVKPFIYVRGKLLEIIGFDEAPLLLPLGVFTLVLITCGFCVGIDPGNIGDGARVATKTLVSLKALVIYPWVYQVLRRAPQMKTPVICTFLVMSSLSCLYAPVEPGVKAYLRNITAHPPQDPNVHVLYKTFEGFIKWVTGSRAPYLQGTGFLEQPMAFAGQMQTVMMMALALLLGRGYKHLPGIFGKRSVAIAIACCIAIGIIFGAERSAWMGVFFGVLVVCANVSRKTVLVSLFGFLVVAGLSYLLVPIVKDRVDVLFKAPEENTAIFKENESGPFKDPSVVARFHIWEATIDKFKKKPIFGTSLIRFGVIHAKSAMPDKGYFDHAHSNYLHMLAATGIVGFAAYMYLLFMTFAITAKLSKSHSLEGLSEREVEQLQFDRSIAIGLLAASTSLAVSGLFEFNFGTGHVRLTYFYWLAFLAVNTYDKSQSMRSHEKLAEPII